MKQHKRRIMTGNKQERREEAVKKPGYIQEL
uniref:Uncharacterized protein n=1 Tax=Solanum lycopersicum TaxID=4081 RepID=A0A3Q7J0J9_SOLLC